MHIFTVQTPETKIIYTYLFYVYIVFRKEFHTLGSKCLIAFEAIWRLIAKAGKDSKTSYTDALLFIPFIQLLDFYNSR
jgi:hypothetical protein